MLNEYFRFLANNNVLGDARIMMPVLFSFDCSAYVVFLLILYIFQVEPEIWMHGNKDGLVKQATTCEASISLFGIIFWDSIMFNM